MPTFFILSSLLGNILIRKRFLEGMVRALAEPSGIEFPLTVSPKGLDNLINLLSYTSVAVNDVYKDQGFFIEPAEVLIPQMYMGWLNTVQNNPSPENLRLRSVIQNQFLPLLEQIIQ